MKVVSIIVGIIFVILLIRFFLKNRDGSFDKETTWKVIGDRQRQCKECPDCGTKPHDLLWFEFRSSNESWRNLVGRQGYYSKCPNCEKVVEEIITVMN